MKRFNKHGSVTMSFVMFVVIMMVSMQFLVLGSSQKQTISRHSKQLENIYSYEALASVAAKKVQNSFSQYQVKAPRDNLSGTIAYSNMAEDLRMKFIRGSNEYILSSPDQLIQSPHAQKILQKQSFKMSILVEDLFKPDLRSDKNILNYASGDKLYFKPYTIEITASDMATAVTKTWKVSGVYADITVSASDVVMTPNFSQVVMRPSSSSYS